ncbi:Starch-binding associating with outer membrane [Parapedobacter composti]|uniref:Starch-binding associating with outer membrane n=1 Tax=Parapedobacter composti TaxID=623281 RepID=A0A1I1K1A4_9SPHI|nr:RagB/SusD family nutrient uptake outer membrane protein [Parapedobacter composti]SFC52538.1 Starch-binding associating with outer membrane [Parapedobacter composti]
MKVLKKILNTYSAVALLVASQSCSADFLNEIPMSDYSTVGILTSETGFEAHMTALHQAARDEMAARDGARYFYIMSAGTDIADFGNSATHSTDYNNLLTPFVGQVEWVWEWAYRDMFPRANTIIAYADNPELADIWSSEQRKNAMIAEAKFFRAYTHNLLANLYGDVPIVDTIYTSPKTDFVRNRREDVLQFAREDLEFASEWLPTTVEKQGRIVKAAADHLLTEVYISLGEYELAVESANKVINSGLYQLTRQRFGTKLSEPGDPFSDMFRDGNQNRSSGNMESIYVWQFEDMTLGGQGGSNGNNRLRNWGPWYERLTDPDGRSGMVVVDSLGRGTGQVRPTPYFLYQVWEGDWDNDMRNSVHNMRRELRYTNPASAYFGQVVERKTSEIDTMQNIYPYPRKIEGDVGTLTHTGTSWSGRTYQDFIVYRLAETYLLRAEAYFRMGELDLAADDINEVRDRANATLIGASDVTEDFILDERARELITEEPRRRTLVRMGRLVDRVRKYNIRAITRNSIQDHHQWWPIPQSAIDANIGARLEQTLGYQVVR